MQKQNFIHISDALLAGLPAVVRGDQCLVHGLARCTENFDDKGSEAYRIGDQSHVKNWRAAGGAYQPQQEGQIQRQKAVGDGGVWHLGLQPNRNRLRPVLLPVLGAQQLAAYPGFGFDTHAVLHRYALGAFPVGYSSLSQSKHCSQFFLAPCNFGCFFNGNGWFHDRKYRIERQVLQAQRLQSSL